MTNQEQLEPGINVYQFEKGFEGGIIIYPVGRLQLASGNIVRIMFTPVGLKLAICEGSKTNEDIIWTEKITFESTLKKLYDKTRSPSNPR